MFDRDLAELYGVETKRLKERIKRNITRFPADFMFELNKEELKNWRSQFATSNKEKMGLRRPPFVFTEHGVLMLSSVLNSERATQVNIQIMRTFVKIRKLIYSYKALTGKMDEIDEKYSRKYKKHGKKIKEILAALNYLIKGNEQKKKNKQEIGFRYE